MVGVGSTDRRTVGHHVQRAEVGVIEAGDRSPVELVSVRIEHQCDPLEEGRVAVVVERPDRADRTVGRDQRTTHLSQLLVYHLPLQ